VSTVSSPIIDGCQAELGAQYRKVLLLKHFGKAFQRRLRKLDRRVFFVREKRQ
jgi:hypothetical protein